MKLYHIWIDNSVEFEKLVWLIILTHDTMHSRIENVYDQLEDFSSTIGTWLWDTVGLIIDILLEFLGRSIELTIAILHLAFQVICFLRDLCIEAMQTFANIFRGIVNVVGSIDSDDVEDFATACIVVILWVGAGKFILGAIDKNTGRYNPLNLFGKANVRMRSNGHFEHQENCPAIQESTWLRGTSSSRKKSIGLRKRNSAKY